MKVIKEYINFVKEIGDRAPAQEEIEHLLMMESLIRYEGGEI